ncbi:hypothetical protein ABTY59_33670 [Streptomyces sp. NPDC096079]|uniref:hypothetical protein n=1 Tax=Streptomyces sp. NPDC096079 TaxID=3155820 RepID=UPI00333413CC
MRRYFVVLTAEYDPAVLHVEAAPDAPDLYDSRREWHIEAVREEQAPLHFQEVTAATFEAAGQAALLTAMQRRAAEYAEAYAQDRADEDDEQAAPEPDRRPGAGQLAIWGTGPQQPRRNITRTAHTPDLISTP